MSTLGKKETFQEKVQFTVKERNIRNINHHIFVGVHLTLFCSIPLFYLMQMKVHWVHTQHIGHEHICARAQSTAHSQRCSECLKTSKQTIHLGREQKYRI